MSMVAYEDYIKRLHSEADAIYEVAEEARSKGHDPKITVEIPKAKDLACLLYTSDAADDSLRVDLGGRRIIKKQSG